MRDPVLSAGRWLGRCLYGLIVLVACAPRPANGIIKAKAKYECRPGAECDEHFAWMCEYPGGSCRCSKPEYCAGIPPGPEYEALPTTWRCEPYPPAVREDGCPGSLPQSGDCEEEGQSCAYEVSCCTETSVCTDGQWVTGPLSDCPL